MCPLAPLGPSVDALCRAILLIWYYVQNNQCLEISEQSGCRSMLCGAVADAQLISGRSGYIYTVLR